MWIILNDSFLSIVAETKQAGMLLVRARKAGDIENVFPDAETWEDTSADYHFRANLPRERVAAALAGRVTAIDYRNFKDSVPDAERHDAYFQVWDALWKWGRRGGKPREEK